MMLRPPILIDIRKDHFTVKSLGTPPLTCSDIIEGRKVFYKTPRIAVDDFEANVHDLKKVFQRFRPNSFGTIVKPVVIMNVPYEITPVEINSLKELSELAGAREVIILNEPQMPSDKELLPNHKIPGKIVYGEDRFTSDEGFLFFLFTMLLLGSWVLYMSLIVRS